MNAIQAGNRLLENGFELTEKNSNSMFRKSAVNDDVTIDVSLGKDIFTVKVYEQLNVDEFRDIAIFSADYGNLGIDPIGNGKFSVTFDVTNTGKRDAAEVAQLYVGAEDPAVVRPAKELKGYEKVFLKKGETRRITIELGEEAFRHYDYMKHDFTVHPGKFNIFVGSSSQDIRLEGSLVVE